MQEKAPRRKRAVNVSIDAELAADAKEFGTNISAVLEKALEHELRESREQKWREENRAAIKEYNEFVATNGLLSDEWRSF